MKHLKDMSIYNHDIYRLDTPIKGYSFVERVYEDDYHATVCELGEVEGDEFQGSGLYFELNSFETLTEEKAHSAKIRDTYIWS